MEILILFIIAIALIRIGFYLKTIQNQNNLIMAKQKEFAKDIQALSAQFDKVKTEITDKIQSLEDALDNADNVDPEVQTAFDELKGKVQALDDIHPDQVTPPTEPPVEPPTEEPTV